MMTDRPLAKAIVDMMQPVLRRPALLQVAALCTRQGRDGTEVLLITSRGTGRWILPKGWPIAHHSLAEAAAQEAWEEAGVRGRVEAEAFGSFDACKVGDGGLEMPCRICVYRIHVDDMADRFPEAGQRDRRWVGSEVAAGMVREPGLQALLAAL